MKRGGGTVHGGMGLCINMIMYDKKSINATFTSEGACRVQRDSEMKCSDRAISPVQKGRRKN